MAVSNVIRLVGNTINNKKTNTMSLCLNCKKNISKIKKININVRKNNDLRKIYIPQKKYKCICPIVYYVSAVNGIDEIDAGAKEKPFKSLDYCIEQMYERNIFNNDICIDLDEGIYNLGNRKIFDGQAGKNLYIIGTGINTTINFIKNFQVISKGTGTFSFNVHFYKMIITADSDITGANFLLSYATLHLKNVLFKNLPKITYGFFSFSSNDILNTIQNCVAINESDISMFRGISRLDKKNTFNNYGFFDCAYECDNSVFINNNRNKYTTSPNLDSDYNIIDTNINISEIGLYAGEYNWSEDSKQIYLKNSDNLFEVKRTDFANIKDENNLKIEKQIGNNIIGMIKQNPYINAKHLSYKEVPKIIVVNENRKSLKRNIITRETNIYVTDSSYNRKINPIVKTEPALIIVNGKEQDDCNQTEENIKGFNFVVQKRTYVEISLDFLKKDTMIDNISGLPEGLFFENNKIKGVSLKSGDYKIDINMNDGSSVECNLSVPSLIRLL